MRSAALRACAVLTSTANSESGSQAPAFKGKRLAARRRGCLALLGAGALDRLRNIRSFVLAHSSDRVVYRHREMGTWGTGIFANDVATDVRDEYRSLLGDGLSGQEATVALLQRMGDVAEDDDDSVPFWLALAATQSQLGLLETRVKDRANAIIDSGADLQRWEQEAPSEVSQRRRALATLRARLTGEQPPPKKVTPRKPLQPKFTPGEIIAYRLDDGRFLLLRVVGHATEQHSRDTVAIMELVNWVGEDIPAVQQITRMAAVDWSAGWDDPILKRSSPNPYCVPLVLGRSMTGRLTVVGNFDPPAPPVRRKRPFSQESGWHLVSPVYLRWDGIPDEAERLLPLQP